MKKRMAGMLAAVAMLLTATASVGCAIFIVEEPKALKNMDWLINYKKVFTIYVNTFLYACYI